MSGADRTRGWTPCAGTGEPARELVSAAVARPDVDAIGRRQTKARYATGVCPACGRVRSVNADERMRAHAASVKDDRRGR